MTIWAIHRPSDPRCLIFDEIEIENAQITIKDGEIVDCDVMEPGDHLVRKNFVMFVKEYLDA